MPKRLIFSLLTLIIALSVITLAAAQDAPPPPNSSTDLDAVVGTPAPLPTMGERPAPSQTIGGTNATLTLYFPNLAQGTVGLIEVSGANVTGASATWLEGLIEFFTSEERDGQFALLAVGMEQSPRRDYPLSVSVLYDDGTRETLTASIEIVLGGFIRREVIIPPDKGFLLDSETETAELARLESLFVAVTTERLWDEQGFLVPIPSVLTAPFGEFRVFNATLNTRHTGWDIRCTVGTPIFASAAGRVVFAGTLPIRGNYVVIDHGYGVYSGYAHLSVTNVTRGQDISREQVIGMTGNTGRTSGPHFHWEMAVNGEWIDSVQFLRMWMP